MGEAYDRTGAFLGAAEAESMKHVLDKLQEAHPHAAEYRLKDLNQVLAGKDAELREGGIAGKGETNPRDRMLQVLQPQPSTRPSGEGEPSVLSVGRRHLRDVAEQP